MIKVSGADDDKEERSHWTLDRRIPLAVVLVLALQSAAIIYWAAGIEARVDQSEEALDRFRPRVDALERSQYSGATSLARLEEQLKAYARQLDRIENLVQTLTTEVNNDRKK